MTQLKGAIQEKVKPLNNTNYRPSEISTQSWSNALWKKGNDWKFIFNQQYQWSSATPPIAVMLKMKVEGRGTVKVRLDAYTTVGLGRSRKNIYTWTIDEHNPIADIFWIQQLGMMDEEFCEVGVSFIGLSDAHEIFSNGELMIEF